MNEHEAHDLLRGSNIIHAADLPDPRESPDAQQLLASILTSAEPRGDRATRFGRRRFVLRHRLAFGLVAAAIATGAVIAAAVFPGSSETSTGLSIFSTRGTPTSFASSARIRGVGRPFVLAQFGDRVLFRAERTGSSTCYGSGKLRNGALDVLQLDCTPFPSASRPVLDEIGVDASSRAGGGTLLFVEGFAADGVARMQLVADSGEVLATAPVDGNVFRFEGIERIHQTGAKLLALDPDQRVVWSRAL
jgi:hypothetical protein